MALFIDPARKARYTPEEEQAKEFTGERHVFLLRCLTAREWQDRSDGSREAWNDGSGRVKINLGSWERLTLKYGLIGVEGPGAFPVPFAIDPFTGRVSDEFLDSLHPDLRRELAVQIDRISKLDRADTKA